MSTNIAHLENDGRTLRATRYCGAAFHHDRVRLQLLITSTNEYVGPEGVQTFNLSRQEWATLKWQIDRAFEEFPEPTQTG